MERNGAITGILMHGIYPIFATGAPFPPIGTPRTFGPAFTETSLSVEWGVDGGFAQIQEALIRAIAGIADRFRRYGHRRITAMLQEEGWQVNHKRPGLACDGIPYYPPAAAFSPRRY